MPRHHVCPVCDRSFQRKEHLVRHNRTHTKEKPFSCSVCSKRFSRSDEHLRHLRIHDKKGVVSLGIRGERDQTSQIPMSPSSSFSATVSTASIFDSYSDMGQNPPWRPMSESEENQDQINTSFPSPSLTVMSSPSSMSSPGTIHDSFSFPKLFLPAAGLFTLLPHGSPATMTPKSITEMLFNSGDALIILPLPVLSKI